MSKKRLIISVLLIGLIVPACNQTHSKWQGSREEIDGVTVIMNPKDPMYTEDIFSLEEELTIGEPEGDQNYMFSQANDLAVSEDERIFVLDTKAVRIQVYTQEGRYLKTIGNKGQGPGEMQYPTSIYITPKEELLIMSSGARMLNFYSLEGEFIRSLSSAKMTNLEDPKVDMNGNILANFSVPGDDMKSELAKFNPDLEPILTIASTKLFTFPNMQPYFPQHFWQITEEDHIIWGKSTHYELNILNSEGTLIKKIIKAFDPVAITEKDKKERLQFLFGDNPVPPGVNLEWPDYHVPFMYLSLDENGRIFTRTFAKTLDSGEYYFDVFDSEGQYVAKIPLPARPQVWKKGKLYTLEEDLDGYQYIKRYKATWKI